MTDDEPERLKATGDTPNELVRALRALGRDRDGERLARVATRLSATLAASGAPAGGALRNLFGSKIGLTGVALGFGVLGALGYQWMKSDSASVERPSISAPAPTPAPAPHAPIMPSTASTPVPTEAIEAQPDSEPHRREEPPRVKRAPRPAPYGTEPPHRAEENSPGAAELEPARADETAATRATSLAKPEDAEPTAQAPALPPPPSEELLLLKARSSASRQPSEALRLLDEHAARFPSGLLVPEREVLAIEVLRSLNRGAEADRRLQRFKARYPQSIHLRRIEQSGSDQKRD